MSKLNDVKNWGYFINNTDKRVVHKSSYQMVVIDTCDSDGNEFSSEDIKYMKEDGKLLIAYISLGEAENYRWYWKKEWNKRKPPFIGKENPDWPGNYPVNFWHPEWRTITEQILDKVITQGFDGIYIDKVDVYNDLGGTEELIKYIKNYIYYVSFYVKSRIKDFIVISQNAEELARDKDDKPDLIYLSCLDGIAREDLWFTGDADGNKGPKTPASEVNEIVDNLNIWKANGKAVFVVEYVSGKLWHYADERLKKLGFIGTSQPRELDDLRTV